MKERPASKTNTTDISSSQAAASYEIAPQDTNAAEERVEITAFADDSAVVAESVPGETTLSGRDTNQHTDSMQHSVISFLQRPKLIRSFEWGPDQHRDSNGLLLQGKEVIIPNSMLIPLVRNKLDGFTSLRATCVVKLQINAQPFQAGRLIMSAIPVPTLLQDRAVWIKKAVALQQPINHVQIDIAKQTEVSLRIPFVSPFNSFDLIHGEFPWAEVCISVYSPLVSAGDMKPLECLLWYHFEDIELGAPTSGQVIPLQQSGRVAPKEVPQVQLAAARASEERGLISSIAGTVKNVSSTVSDAVPILKPISGIVNTVADVVGGIAGIFGWSKPLIGQAGTTVVARPTQYFANSDGIDHSINLSLAAMNVVDVYPGLGGTDLDETALDYIKKIPQFIGFFNYGNNNKYGDFLWKTYVTPTYVIPNQFNANLTTPTREGETGLPVSLILKQPTSLHYASSVFAYWTGSMVYTLRFVKTNFHSGRVEVSFHPFVSQVDTERMEYVYRLVVDLRDNSEVSFTVPYIAPQPWKRVDSKIYDSNEPIPTDWSVLGRSITGVLYIRALTPLICATSIIAPTIECVVEARAGDDFRLQSPTSSVYGPVELRPLPVEQSGKVYALPGTQETRTSSLEGFTPASITGSESDVNRIDTQKFCAGETFESYRQLTRRYAFTRKFPVVNQKIYQWLPTTLVRPPVLSINYVPNRNSEDYLSKTVLSFDSAPIPLSYVSSMYAFYRGGVRVKAVTWGYKTDIKGQATPQTDFNPVLLSGRVNYIGAYQDGDLHFGNNYMAPIGYELNQQKIFSEFKLPYYSPTLVSVHWTHDATTQFDQPQVALELTTSDKPDEKMGVCKTWVGDQESDVVLPDARRYMNIAVAGADDMDFHLFLGSPFVIPAWRVPLNTHVGLDYPNDFNTENLQVDPCYFLAYTGSYTDTFACKGITQPACEACFLQTYRDLSASDFTVTSVNFSEYAGDWNRSTSPRSPRIDRKPNNNNKRLRDKLRDKLPFNQATNNVAKPNSDEEYQRRVAEYRQRLEEQRKRQEEESKRQPPTVNPTGRKLFSVGESESSDDERVPDEIDSQPVWDNITEAWRNVILPPDTPRGR